MARRKEATVADVSVVVPAYNEAGAVADTVGKIRDAFRGSGHSVTILVVDDGSADETAEQARRAGALVLRHPCNIGYGNAILTGVRHVHSPYVAITDADGTYPLDELPGMVNDTIERGLDMLVGARRGKPYHGSPIKRLARLGFKLLAEFACGRSIPDINSGLRVMRRKLILQFADVLCGGFSFTTTLTIITILSGGFVDYRNIDYARRIGRSHVRYLRDTLRTAQILVTTILLFNPIKLFLLASLFVLGLGFAAALLYLLAPACGGGIAVGSLFVLASALLMGLGFLADQHRYRPLGHRARLNRAVAANPLRRAAG
jgi:glycosyltransferase involved in cell wall biosynthesis